MLGSLFVLSNCELPESPDFKTDQRVDIPLMQSRELKFLGGANALIDTTKSGIDTLLSVDPNGLVSLSFDESFDFGDLTDAVPDVTVDPTSVNAEVGPLSLNDFASDTGPDGLGKANFQQLTGVNPALVPAGSFLPAGGSPNPVNINLATDYFVSATITSGGISVTLTNRLGFNLSSVTMALKSGATAVGNINFTNLLHNTQQTSTLTIPAGTVLQSLNVDVSIAWGNQNTQAQPDELVVQNVSGQALVASEVVAAVGPQSFETAGEVVVAEDQFLFTQPTDYIEVESGTIDIARIANNMGLGIETFTLSFPSILRAPYGVGDSLVITFAGATALTAGREILNYQVSLANTRIIAPNNEVRYSVAATTEDMRQGAGSNPATIRATDNVFASVGITGLAIRQATGVIVSRTVDLNDDAAGSAPGVDLFNDEEANLIEVGGLEDFSDKLEGLEFTDASFSVAYTSNIGVPAKVVGAFVGSTPGGERFYLRGLAGGALEVPSTFTHSFTADGVPVPNSNLIQFDLTPSPDGNLIQDEVVFDRNNSTITDFLNKLPNEIRFVGVAMINPDNQRGIINKPVRFDPFIAVNIPLALRTLTAANYQDTMKMDLSGTLPEPEDDLQLNAGTLIIDYENRLPLEIGLDLRFLDENFAIVTQAPLPTEADFVIQAAPVDANGFVSGARIGALTINLSKAQLDQLNRTRHLGLEAHINSSGNQEVRVRATDGITVAIRARFSTGMTVN